MQRGEVPVFRVGTLTVRGGKVTFQPGPEAFEAPCGGRADIAVTYDFEEAGAEREALDLRFTVEVGGKALGTEEERLDDTPLVKDEVRGALARTATFPQAGLVQGRFVVEGIYAKGPWKGGDVAGGAGGDGRFRHEGRFRVQVR